MEHQTYILGVTPETLSSLPGNSWCTERTHSHNLPSDPCGTGLPPPSKKNVEKPVCLNTLADTLGVKVPRSVSQETPILRPLLVTSLQNHGTSLWVKNHDLLLAVILSVTIKHKRRAWPFISPHLVLRTSLLIPTQGQNNLWQYILFVVFVSQDFIMQTRLAQNLLCKPDWP